MAGTHFNARRVFTPTEILSWIEGKFILADFHYVDDVGDLHAF